VFNTRFLLLAALGLLAACASQPAKHSTNTAATDVQCHEEQSTGSLIAHTVCTTAADRQSQKQNVNDARNAASMPTSGCAPPHGCAAP
jgi:uncharacterized lipoprotein YajG